MLVELLVLLAERSGQVVRKDEILDRVWASRFVSESALTRTVAELRQCLGDSAGRPTIIETIPKRGYRLIGDVEVLRATPEEKWREARPMIAVLPFENLTGDPDQEYFSDGVTEEVITRLGAAHPDEVGVIARTSVMPYKHAPKPLAQVAAELTVQYVLEGSVRREASRVRITAQLIRAADQTHLWADSYDGPIEEVLALQDRVAQAICEAIKPRISHAAPRTHLAPRHLDPAAHDAYLRGLYNWNKFTPEAAAQAVNEFQQCISLDPEHAPAHAALAHVYGMIGYWGFVPPAQVNPLARAEALRAIQIDESLSIAHAALGCVLCLHDWAYEAGEKELRRAIELNPSEATNRLWYAIYHAVFRENAEKAVTEARAAARLDPWSPITALMVSSVYLLLQDFEQAREQAQAIVERTVKLATADAVRVSVGSSHANNVRFAANQISTAGSVGDATMTVQAAFGPRHAAVSTNDFSDEGLRRAVRQAESLARLAPDDPESMPELGPQQYVPVSAWFESTANLGAADRARLIELYGSGPARP
jgi:TolB-like protein/Tfp pilus assembly protein PilF